MVRVQRARTYVVECFWPGLTSEVLEVEARRVEATASRLRLEGHDLTFLGTIFVPDDECVFCLFDGTESDVRTASSAAGIPFERVLPAERRGI